MRHTKGKPTELVPPTFYTLSEQPNEPYTHFIERIKKNSLATKVKLNDLRDNMDITRLTFITEEDTQRLNKYLKAYHSLSEK